MASLGQGRPKGPLGKVDRHVAARIRDRRMTLGMTQQQLAAAIKVTYQQAHKYEVGIHRVSAARLHQMAEALGVGVAYFFTGVANSAKATPPPHLPRLAELARN